MSAPIPDSIPAQLGAGDTTRWRRDLPDYPASAGWVLSYTLIGPNAVYNATATADGTAHLVSLAAAVTAGWEPGRYRLVEVATSGTDRFTTANQQVTVSPNLAAASVGSDTRTHARIVLDSLNAWLESKAPTAGEVQIGDRRVRNHSLVELLALRDRYAALVRGEEAGNVGGNKLLVRF